MKRSLIIGALVAAVVPHPAAAQTETLADPVYGRLAIYAPADAASAVVLFLSGDLGWNTAVASIAGQLRNLGALVVGIDTRSFRRGLAWSEGCTYPAADLEQLARNVQLHRKLPVYKRPILVGYASGATLVYAALASAPPETFAGAISLAFCPDIVIRPPLCEMRGLKTAKRRDSPAYDVQPYAGLNVPWVVLQGAIDRRCSPARAQTFVAATGGARLVSLPHAGHEFDVPRDWAAQLIDAYRPLAASVRPEESAHPAVPAIADLPLVEVPAEGGVRRDDMAVIVTGDGGWAEIDKSVAASLAASGVPVVGWSSLRYFWTARAPDSAAADLVRIITHYTAAWQKRRVILIGYSFGADVLPFLVTRLPPEALGHVAKVALLGLSPTASFEFHVADWLGHGSATQYRTVPEVQRLSVPVLCVRGAGENDSACSSLTGRNISVATIGDGHHFGGEYRRVADAILQR